MQANTWNASYKIRAFEVLSSTEWGVKGLTLDLNQTILIILNPNLKKN